LFYLRISKLSTFHERGAAGPDCRLCLLPSAGSGTEEAKRFLNQFGGDPYLSTPDEAQAALLQDIKDWEGYVRTARVEPQG
jgi:hypothetical protein